MYKFTEDDLVKAMGLNIGDIVTTEFNDTYEVAYNPLGLVSLKDGDDYYSVSDILDVAYEVKHV